MASKEEIEKPNLGVAQLKLKELKEIILENIQENFKPSFQSVKLRFQLFLKKNISD